LIECVDKIIRYYLFAHFEASQVRECVCGASSDSPAHDLLFSIQRFSQQTEIKEGFAHSNVLERDETVSIQKLVESLLQLPVLTHEAVIEVTVLRWVNSDEVASSFFFKQCFDDYVTRLLSKLQELL